MTYLQFSLTVVSAAALMALALSIAWLHLPGWGALLATPTIAYVIYAVTAAFIGYKLTRVRAALRRSR